MAVTKVYSPEADEGFLSLQVENGGTSARTPAQAAENLGVVTTDQIGQTDGVCLLDEGGFVKRSDCPNSFPDPSLPVLYGEHSFYNDEELRLQIVNYDMYVDYQVNTSQMGSSNYVLDQGLIIITHNGNPVGLQTLNINGRLFEYEILERKPYVPYITNLAWVNLDGYNQFGQNLPFSGQLFTSSPFGDFTNTLTHSYTRWQVSTEPTFGTIAFESSDPGEKDNITITFSPDTDYYLRMAHIATNGVSSGWSDVYKLHTTKLAVINTPAITTPANNATGVQINPTLFSTPYSVTDFAGVHVSTDWQVATDAAFTNIVFSSISDQVNKGSIQVNSGLNYAGMYYARCRHKADIAASNGTSYSEWSPAVGFTVMADNRYVRTPIATLVNDIYNNLSTTSIGIRGDAFTAVNYSDSHQQSQWQIASDSGFGTVVHDSGWGNNLVAYDAVVNLLEGTNYFTRVRYKGLIKISDWSDSKNFATGWMADFALVGAGAGGGGPSTNGGWTNAQGNAGSGGGGGGVRKLRRILTSGVTYTLTIGQGGLGGQGPGQQGADGGDTVLAIGATVLSTAGGGKRGNGGGQNTGATPGGVGGTGDNPGGQGGQGGSMMANQSGATYYAGATDGQGVVPGLLGRADLGYGTGPYGGGGGGSPTIAVDGLTFRGGQGNNANVQSHDGATGSGGGGAAYIAGTGGRGGDGGFVMEYPNTLPLLNAPGAVYSNVNGKHRYVWSTAGAHTFTMTTDIYAGTETITKPAITGTSGSAINGAFTSNAFQSNLQGSTHLSTDWQLATDPSFTNIVRSTSYDATNKTAWSTPSLSYSTTYYVRCRYRSMYATSAWSEPSGFTTMADNRAIQTPSLSITYPFGPDSDGNRRPVPTASGFVPVNFPGPHESSDWQIWKEPNFTPGLGVYETYADSSKLYSIESAGRWVFMYPKAGEYYYARVRFRSQGIVSAWSATLKYYFPT